jgi:DNA polymerase III subunit beta
MELICGKEDLLKGIHTVEKAVAVRSTLPVISNILLETVEGGIKMVANNLEIGIEVIVKAEIIKEGAILVPSKTFSGIIAKIPEGDVAFKVEGTGNISITCQQSNFNIHGLAADEFPALPKIKADSSFTISSELFKDLVKHTIIAVSLDETKHVLNGILFEVNGNEISFVATDGYRLAKKNGELSEKAGKFKVIIPTKALAEMNRIVQQNNYQGDLNISLSKEQVSFSFGDVYFVSRLIQGQFPDYQQVIPKKSDSKMIINRSELLGASERTSIIASISAGVVKLETIDSKLHIAANTPEVGNVSELLDIEIDGKEKNKVSFNVRLLLDALRIIEEEQVSLELTGTLSPGILRPKENSDFLYVIMPIRTAES